jgi:hypothetical protein
LSLREFSAETNAFFGHRNLVTIFRVIVVHEDE